MLAIFTGRSTLLIDMRALLYKQLMRGRLSAIDRMQSEMGRYIDRPSKESFQIRAFNKIWRNAVENVPFYADWALQYKLPKRIKSLSDLDNWPILTKANLRNIAAFKRTDVPNPATYIMTGGSTGEPVRLPAWRDSIAGVSQLLGRRAYGIELGVRTFLLWGHEHLYGTGVNRKVNALKRRLKDWLAGWTRVSAYDLGADAMHWAFAQLVKCSPEFVIGFSPAVLAFVRQNAAHAHEVGSVKVILCTAGPLTTEEKQEIVDFFTSDASVELGSPKICMEYGSVECAIMAYTRPSDGEYDVFWNTHLIQAVKQLDGEYKNIVTRLTDCYVPLIRYDIGDYLDMGNDSATADEERNWEHSVFHFRSVRGRPSEMIKFACGVSFFGALIGDCVKQIPNVLSSQIAVNEERNELEIRVTANRRLFADELSLIQNRFFLTVENAAKLTMRVVQVEKLFTTVGGKTPRVVRI